MRTMPTCPRLMAIAPSHTEDTSSQDRLNVSVAVMLSPRRTTASGELAHAAGWNLTQDGGNERSVPACELRGNVSRMSAHRIRRRA